MREAAVGPGSCEKPAGTVVPVRMGFCNVYLVKADDGYVLVDTGMLGDGRVLRSACSRAGIEFPELRLIIITHAHVDHAGAVADAKRMTGAQVLCHQQAAPFLRAGDSAPVVTHSQFMSLINAVMPSAYRPVDPDIVIADEFDLREYGVAGRVIHTPGHTRGSITVCLDNGEMLLGDLVRGKGAKIHIGSFYQDRKALQQSLCKLAALHPRKIHLSHGGVTDGETLRRVAEATWGQL
jgi:glyoxylase-like metal-dependent hydrolase (beta-lactamase superfamily II)